MNKIRKGDEVIVLAGRDKSNRGIVASRVNATYVLIEGINLFKKHLKANPKANHPGGITEKSLPIHISNVALLNPESNKADRIKIKKIDNKKTRTFRSNNSLVNLKV